jgi:hypothetical protein
MSSVDDRAVRLVLSKLQKNIKNPKRFLNRQGNELIEGIITRTQRGNKDYKGIDFKDYTPTSKIMRADAGYSPNTVNLTQTGQMLDSIKSTTSKKNELTIHITNGEALRKARKHQTGDGVRKREFFGLDKEQKKDTKKQLLKFLSKDFK